jgi:hypothetical protein
MDIHPSERTLPRWVCPAAIVGVLLSLTVLSGCNPASLSMLLMPWYDDKEPAKCKLSIANKETTVAIVTWFGNHDLQH